MQLRDSTRDIAIVSLMKLFSKVVDNQFASLSPQNFLSVNGTCQLKQLIPELGLEDSALSWIYATRYLLPVLGGLLASMCFSYLAVMQLCGYIMLLGSILLSVAVYNNFICQTTTAVTLVAWLLIPIVYGIIQPCVVYCLYRWHPDPRVWPILAGIYYLVQKSGELCGLLLPLTRDVIGNHYTLVCIVICIAFIIMSRWVHTEDHVVPFVMPTKARLVRYFKIFSPMIFFSIAIVDSRSMVYSTEMRHYLNFTSNYSSLSYDFVPPEIAKNSSQIIWSLLFILIAYYLPKQPPLEPRLQAGIVLEALTTIALLVTSLSPPDSALAVRVIFLVASITDGVAELLTVAAAYEIMNGVAPRSCKLLVFGICFTVWGLATLTGRCLVSILVALPSDNPVLLPTMGKPILFFVYHIIILLLLAVSSAYYHFVAYPIASMLYMSCEIEYPNIDDEAAPLIEFRRIQ